MVKVKYRKQNILFIRFLFTISIFQIVELVSFQLTKNYFINLITSLLLKKTNKMFNN